MAVPIVSADVSGAKIPSGDCLRVGAYEVLSELGRGGAGAVFKAKAPDGRVVAVKVLIFLTQAARDRFAREFRIQGSFGEQDGFVPVLDGGDTPNGPYIVMPLLEGGSLADRLRRGSLDVPTAVRVGSEIARAVGKAHARGLVHRDLKPGNVLFPRQGGPRGDWGRPLVSDLGLAKHFDSQAEGASKSISLSKTNELRGTPGYMAPEQMNDAKRVGPPADVFALGVLVYECLCRAQPFAADSVHGVMGRVSQGEFTRLRSVRRDVPRAVAAVIEACFSPDPKKRPPDGTALAEALEAALVPARRGRLLAVVAALAAACAVIGGLALAPQLLGKGTETAPSPPPPPAPVVAMPAPPPELPALPKLPRPPACYDSVRGDGVLQLETVLAVPRPAHPEWIWGVAVSPDGTLAASGGGDRLIKIWSVPSGVEVRTITGHPGPVRGVAFSPDGALVFAAGEGGPENAHVWDVATGASVAAFRVGAGVRAVDYARAGDIALTGDEAGHVVVWSMPGGTRVRSLDGHTKPVWTVKLSADGQRALSGSEDGTLRLWNVPTGELVKTFEDHGDWVVAAHFLADGRRALSAGRDQTIRLWDLEAMKLDRTIRVPAPGLHTEGEIHSCAVSPDEKLAVCGVYGQRLLLLDLASGKPLRYLGMHAHDRIMSVAFTPDGERVLSGSHDRMLALSSVKDGRNAWEKIAHTGPVELSAVSADGLAALTCASGEIVQAWDLANGQRSMPPYGSANGVAFEGEGKNVVLVHKNELHRFSDGKEIGQWPLFEPGGEGDARLADDGRTLFLLSKTKVRAKETATGRIAIDAPPLPDGEEPRDLVSLAGGALVACSTSGKMFTAAAPSYAWRPLAGSGEPDDASAPATLVPVPDRPAFLLGREGGTVEVWTLVAGAAGDAKVSPIAGVDDAQTFHPVGSGLAAVAGKSGSLRVFDIAGAPREVANVDLNQVRDSGTTLAAGGRRLLVGTNRGAVLLYTITR